MLLKYISKLFFLGFLGSTETRLPPAIRVESFVILFSLYGFITVNMFYFIFYQ